MNKKERMYARIEKHSADLNAIFNTPFDNVTLCKKLHRLEIKAHRLAEDYCNGYIDGDQWENESEAILEKVRGILDLAFEGSFEVFVNGDPRGYALKINDEWVKDADIKIYRDFGGYGILAPEFDGE